MREGCLGQRDRCGISDVDRDFQRIASRCRRLLTFTEQPEQLGPRDERKRELWSGADLFEEGDGSLKESVTPAERTLEQGDASKVAEAIGGVVAAVRALGESEGLGDKWLDL